MRLAWIALALSATSLFAQSPDPFPADFTPSPCAPANSCQSFPLSSFPSAAANLLAGRSLTSTWVDEHAGAVVGAMGLACRRHASCLATPGNTFIFCDDVLYAELEPVCDRMFPKDKNRGDWDQCTSFRDVYLLGIEQQVEDVWKGLRPCIKKNEVVHTKPLEVWMEPAKIPAGFKGEVKFFALDPDTRIPILARIAFEGQSVLAPVNAVGDPATFYPFTYPLKYIRVPNADGHTDLIPPEVTITAPAYPNISDAPPYPQTKFRLPADVPKLKVEMTPAPDRLRSGHNTVTISAHDAANGAPVEMRVMVGSDQIGNTNTPLTIDAGPSGHHPEIWLTSLFNRYSDVVVARAR